MSVIVMGKDVPQTCVGCFLHDWGMCAVSKGLASNKERPAHCPLKSVEGLIEKVESLPTQQSTDGQDMYQAYDVLRAIREYCGVSNYD